MCDKMVISAYILKIVEKDPFRPTVLDKKCHFPVHFYLRWPIH